MQTWFGSDFQGLAFQHAGLSPEDVPEAMYLKETDILQYSNS